MRSLLSRPAAVSLIATLLLGAVDAGDPTGGGGHGGDNGGNACVLGPLACVGVLDALPGSATLGVVGNAEGCAGGRIVDAGAEQSDAIPYCPDVDGDGVADPPPTHGQIVAALCPTAPEPVLATSPPEEGYTGLETWFWSAGPHQVTETGTVAGYRVSCQLEAVEFAVDTGDVHAQEFGHPRHYTSTAPGHDGADTDITHLYERVDTYTQTLAITWARRTHAGADRITSSSTRDYPVLEIRAVATTPS